MSTHSSRSSPPPPAPACACALERHRRAPPRARRPRDGPGAGRVLLDAHVRRQRRNPIVVQRRGPVFVDCDARAGLIDPELLDEALRRRTRGGGRVRAVLAVDLYGQVLRLRRRSPPSASGTSVILLQDAAESLGATYRGATLGTPRHRWRHCRSTATRSSRRAAAGCWPRRRRLSPTARNLSTQAREPVPHYEHTEIGFNYRLSNLLAAPWARSAGRARRTAWRRGSGSYAATASCSGVLPASTFMPEATDGTCNCWLTCITVDPAAFGVRPASRSGSPSRRSTSRPGPCGSRCTSSPCSPAARSTAATSRRACSSAGSACRAARP